MNNKQQMHKKLLDFLRENHIRLDTFFKNAISYDGGHSLSRWLHRPDAVYRCLYLAFFWEMTPEGHDFWFKLMMKAIEKEKESKKK